MTHAIDVTQIRPRRIALGLTLEELAHQADCSISTLWAWEHTKPKRGSRTLRRIVRTLDRLEADHAA
jgi:transcriptional regulator with XRE-family HTH domain